MSSGAACPQRQPLEKQGGRRRGRLIGTSLGPLLIAEATLRAKGAVMDAELHPYGDVMDTEIVSTEMIKTAVEDCFATISSGPERKSS